MSKQTVRIENISIENLKNVKYGYLNFENKKKLQSKHIGIVRTEWIR